MTLTVNNGYSINSIYYLEKSLETRLNVLERGHQLPRADSCRRVCLQLDQILSHYIKRLDSECSPTQTNTQSTRHCNQSTTSRHSQCTVHL